MCLFALGFVHLVLGLNRSVMNGILWTLQHHGPLQATPIAKTRATKDKPSQKWRMRPILPHQTKLWLRQLTLSIDNSSFMLVWSNFGMAMCLLDIDSFSLYSAVFTQTHTCITSCLL